MEMATALEEMRLRTSAGVLPAVPADEPPPLRTDSRRRGKAAKKEKAEKPKAADRRKCTILLTPDTSRRLSLAAERDGCDRSAYVEDLLKRLLSPIVVQIRGELPVLSKSAQTTPMFESMAGI